MFNYSGIFMKRSLVFAVLVIFLSFGRSFSYIEYPHAETKPTTSIIVEQVKKQKRTPTRSEKFQAIMRGIWGSNLFSDAGAVGFTISLTVLLYIKQKFLGFTQNIGSWYKRATELGTKKRF